MGDLYGYTGKILRIDLSSETVSYVDTLKYAPQFLGGLGVAAAVAWEEVGPEVGPFDPENRLFIMAGPLTGTLASGAGRIEVAGVAPQQRPPRFSRSGMGGHWGPELKYAGFDGLILQGKAEAPLYLWIHDGEVELRDASALWGKGTYATTQALRRIHDPRTRVISIGPAGERLARIAILQTETENAAGQGGFGGVMGSKNLKAIAVRGAGGVKIAHPQEFLEECLGASREGFVIPPSGADPRWPAGAPAFGPDFRTRKCGFCASVCTHRLYMGAPGMVFPTAYTTAQQCYGYRVKPEAHPEARALTSGYGLNGWEVSYGIVPWLQLCKQHGLIERVDGLEIPAPGKPIQHLRDIAQVSPEFLARLLRIIAYQEGELGRALAEGACYAAELLFEGKGKPLLDRIYPGRMGQTDHWTGHWGGGGIIYWPWWLPVVLQWCMDTRDPAGDLSHPWTTHVQKWLTESGPQRGPLSLEEVRAVSEKVYGNPDVCDPAFVYDPPEAKAIPAIWHTDSAIAVDALVLCDREAVRVFSAFSPDHTADTSLLARLFSACTGFPMTEEELRRGGERIFNLLRAIDIRNYGRDRRVDEAVVDTVFGYPGRDDGVSLDREKFLRLMDKYYELRGWNKENGWPTRAKLAELGLVEVADALEACGRLG